jgi:hypothetical protein
MREALEVTGHEQPPDVARRLVVRAYRLIELVADDHVLETARERLPESYRPGRGPVDQSCGAHHEEPCWRPSVDGERLGARPDAATALEDGDCRGPGESRPGLQSDEFALVDSRGFVRPYPRPLSRRYGAIGVDRQRPADLGFTVGTSPARVVLVALLRFDAVAGWDVAPLSRARTILGLLENTVPAQSRPHESLAAIERATKSAQGIRGTRGEADEAAAILLEMLSA